MADNEQSIFKSFTDYEIIFVNALFSNENFTEIWKSPKYPNFSIEYHHIWNHKDTLCVKFKGEEVHSIDAMTGSMKEIADKIIELTKKEN
jgi:hypothetical protein